MQGRNNRIFGYDLIKTIAIFLIVFYHLGGLDYGTIIDGEYYLPNLNKFISSLCSAGVPLFFMVNGALLIPKNLDLKQTLLRSLHLLFILVFWKFVLQFFIAYRIFSIKEEMVHFWFLCTLSMVYIISYFTSFDKRIRLLVLLFLVCYPFISNFLLDLIIQVSPQSKPTYWNHTGFFTLYAFLYFCLGDFLKDKTLPSFYSIVLTVFGILLINYEVTVLSNFHQAIYDGVNSSFPTIGALLLSVGIFMLLKGITCNRSLSRMTITFIGSNTMSIYLLHVLFIFILRYHTNILASTLHPLCAISFALAIVITTSVLGHLISNSKLYFLIKLPTRLS